MTKNAPLLGVVAAACALAALPARSQTADELKADGSNTDNVLTYGMGYGQNRYSKLDQITKRNVRKLVPVWSLSLENDFGEQAQPLIYNGTMYVSDAKWTVAIDALTGRQLWRVATDFDAETPRVVCCGVSNKGVALYNGLVLRGTLDGFLVALDQKTGKEVWKQKVIEWKDGYSITGAPTIADGVVITGVSGAEFGIRGFIAGYDAMTGKPLWRRYTTAAPNEPGGDTWPVKDSYQHGGGSTWITGSYDPELDLVYWGVGNSGPWNPNYRGGDSLYVASVIAVKPTTGEIAWHYQFTPNDMFDYDAVSELILGDVPVDGKKRKVVMQFNRNGFLYVLDRANGQLLSAHAYEKMNWASGVDMKSGRPIETDVAKRLRAGENMEIWPNILGGKNWQHASFDPDTGLLYVNTNHWGTTYQLAPLDAFKPGARWMGVTDIKYTFDADGNKGYMKAVDPMTGNVKWSVPQKDPVWSSMLSTKSGLLFTGKHSGDFVAVDIDSGKELWKFKTSSGINASPITWTKDGRQYVTVLSGFGGLGRRFVDDGKNVPNGGSVWTFALPTD